MVKTKGPLFSLDAHGKLGNVLNYSKKKTGSMVRKFHYPKKKVTGAQWTQRHIIGMITARWQTLSAGEKAPYEAAAKIENPVITGFNYFVRVAQADLKTHLDLIAYYSMNELSGNTVYDYSGQGNDGVLSPTYPSDCPNREAAMIPEYGKALYFDGGSDLVNCGAGAGLYNLGDQFTAMGWVNAARFLEGANATGMVTKYWAPQGASFYLVTAAGNKFTWWVTGVSHNTLTTRKINTWYHVTGTYDGAHIRTYVNGVLDSAVTEKTGDIAPTNSPLILGAFVNVGYSLQGYLDEVKIFTRALGVTEIKKHYELLRCKKKRQPTIAH